MIEPLGCSVAMDTTFAVALDTPQKALKIVNLVLNDGMPKFETHEIEPLKKRKWLTKKRLKLKRKREKSKRKDANKKDPRRIRPKGLKKKQKFPTAEARIKYKIEKAKLKEAMLVEKLKKYEVPEVQGPMVKPEELTGEERFYVKKMAQRKSNYVPLDGEAYLEDYSGYWNDTIVFYRGKNYVQPEVMSPIDTLSKKKALEKSKYEQSLETVRRFIAISEKELELYYRHVALYGDPQTRNADLVYGDDQKTPFSMGTEELNFSKEERVWEFTEDETDSDVEEESNCQVDLEDGEEEFEVPKYPA
uniref:Uncharacterized protein n=1 Tax=Ananas comosus var. bracteatus TaxID=296719 RepID=A0A6V7P0Z6_ANACO|nr:unnamed protein product [Ananas comosus var. bracteatus]